MCPNGVDPHQVVIYCAVLWALAGSFWRPASAVLAGGWIVAEAYTMVSCNSLPFGVYLVTDALTLLALWKWGISRLDTAIAALFGLAWGAYLVDYMDMASAYHVWWFLYGCMLAQLVLAGPWQAPQHIGDDLARVKVKGARDAYGFSRDRS